MPAGCRLEYLRGTIDALTQTPNSLSFRDKSLGLRLRVYVVVLSVEEST